MELTLEQIKDMVEEKVNPLEAKIDKMWNPVDSLMRQNSAGSLGLENTLAEAKEVEQLQGVVEELTQRVDKLQLQPGQVAESGLNVHVAGPCQDKKCDLCRPFFNAGVTLGVKTAHHQFANVVEKYGMEEEAHKIGTAWKAEYGLGDTLSIDGLTLTS